MTRWLTRYLYAGRHRTGRELSTVDASMVSPSYRAAMHAAAAWDTNRTDPPPGLDLAPRIVRVPGARWAHPLDLAQAT